MAVVLDLRRTAAGGTLRTSGAGHPSFQNMVRDSSTHQDERCWPLSSAHPKYMLSVKRVGLNPVSTANGSTTRISAMGHKNTCTPQQSSYCLL